MTVNRKASITLESRQDEESQTFHYKGEWFRKEHSLFIRYAEQLDSGDGGKAEARSLLRYSPGELSITRSGAVDSKQWFVRNQRRRGTFRSEATVFELDTLTTALAAYEEDEARLSENGDSEESLPSQLPFIIEWQYELYVEEQLSGRFHIRLLIQEEQKA